MTTREEFRVMVSRALYPDTEDAAEDMVSNEERVLAAWDAQAAEVERLRAEVEAAFDAGAAGAARIMGPPTGVPLTHENAPRAWVVALPTGNVLVADGPGLWMWRRSGCHDTTEFLIKQGATVLAWRK